MKLKQITKFMAVCALLVLGSCEKDFENEGIIKNKIVIEDFSVKSLSTGKNNSKLLTTINGLREKITTRKYNSDSKIVLDSIYNFYFDDENGKYINIDGKISYTFPVYRDSIINKVENVVFNLNNDNEYDIYLLKYGFSKEELFNLSEQEIKNSVLHTTIIQSKYAQTGCGVYVVMCDNNGSGGYAINPHPAGAGCHHAGNGIHLFTEWVSSNCNDTPGYSLPSGGGTLGGGGGGVNPIITVPIPCVICPSEVEIVDPCTTLSNLLNPTLGNARDKILAVQSAGAGFIGEKGATFTNTNGAFSSSPVFSSTTTNGVSYGINIPVGPTIYAAVHSHQDDESQTPMFSFADLMSLYSIYSHTNPENIPNVTFILTLPNSSTFAIKIDNLDSFKNFMNSILNDPLLDREISIIAKKKKMNSIFNNMCCSSCNPSNTQSIGDINDKYIAGFLSTLKNNGISLYRATNNISNWEKLNPPLNANSTVYTSTPCNN